MEKQISLKNQGYMVAQCSIVGGIFGAVSLIILSMPFFIDSSSIWHFYDSYNGFLLMPPYSLLPPPGKGILNLFALLWLNFAGGLIAVVTGFVLADRAKRGCSFYSTSSSINLGVLFLLSGLISIAGSISAMVQLLVIVVLQPHVFTIDFFVGWGVFAELVTGLVITILAFMILLTIPKQRRDAGRPRKQGFYTCQQEKTAPVTGDGAHVEEKHVPSNGRDRVVCMGMFEAIFGILSLIVLCIPFFTASGPTIIHDHFGYSGFMLMSPISFVDDSLGTGSFNLLELLWLSFAGGIMAMIVGFILADRAMHGWSFPPKPNSRNAGLLFMLPGILVIAGSICALVQLFILALELSNVVYYSVGWGAFAELGTGLAITVLPFVPLRNIQGERRDAGRLRKQGYSTCQQEKTAPVTGEGIHVEEKHVPSNGRDRVATLGTFEAIFGILSLMVLCMPFLDIVNYFPWPMVNFSISLNGFMIMSSGSSFWGYLGYLGPPVPFTLLLLSFAGGTIAIIAGVILADRALRGWFFPSAPIPRIANVMLMLPGILVVAGSVIAMVGLFKFTLLNSLVNVEQDTIGWGIFVELATGLAISALSSAYIIEISRSQRDVVPVATWERSSR